MGPEKATSRMISPSLGSDSDSCANDLWLDSMWAAEEKGKREQKLEKGFEFEGYVGPKAMKKMGTNVERISKVKTLKSLKSPRMGMDVKDGDYDGKGDEKDGEKMGSVRGSFINDDGDASIATEIVSNIRAEGTNNKCCQKKMTVILSRIADTSVDSEESQNVLMRAVKINHQDNVSTQLTRHSKDTKSELLKPYGSSSLSPQSEEEAVSKIADILIDEDKSSNLPIRHSGRKRSEVDEKLSYISNLEPPSRFDNLTLGPNGKSKVLPSKITSLTYGCISTLNLDEQTKTSDMNDHHASNSPGHGQTNLLSFLSRLKSCSAI